MQRFGECKAEPGRTLITGDTYCLSGIALISIHCFSARPRDRKTVAEKQRPRQHPPRQHSPCGRFNCSKRRRRAVTRNRFVRTPVMHHHHRIRRRHLRFNPQPIPTPLRRAMTRIHGCELRLLAMNDRQQTQIRFLRPRHPARCGPLGGIKVILTDAAVIAPQAIGSSKRVPARIGFDDDPV